LGAQIFPLSAILTSAFYYIPLSAILTSAFYYSTQYFTFTLKRP